MDTRFRGSTVPNICTLMRALYDRPRLPSRPVRIVFCPLAAWSVIYDDVPLHLVGRIGSSALHKKRYSARACAGHIPLVAVVVTRAWIHCGVVARAVLAKNARHRCLWLYGTGAFPIFCTHTLSRSRFVFCIAR